MTKSEREKWLCNILSVATEVTELLGEDTVKHVLRIYGAKSIATLSAQYYSEVFNDLDFIASDARE